MKRRSDNRGFTLVEIIIAIAILAIVISPLVANFIQSSKLNLQGRKNLNEMNLAQDVMEGISGYAVKDVVAKVDGVISDSSQSLAGNVLPSGATYSGVTKTSSPTDAKIVYKMTNVETAGTEHNKYNVVLTFDPTDSDEEKYNGNDLAAISEVNQYYDAIYNAPATEVDSAVNALYNKSTTTFAKDSYYGKIKRSINITIKDEGTDAAPKYKVRVERVYTPTGELINRAGLPADASYTCTTENISRMEDNQLPRSVYLYYQGVLNSTSGTPMDTINIDSNTGEDITVYLVRIQATNDAGVASNEDISYGRSYGAVVNITSTDVHSSNALTQNVHIVSNLRYDLNATSPVYNFRTVEEDGVTPIDSSKFPKKEDGTTMLATDSAYKYDRAVYNYNGSRITEALYKTHFDAGYAREEKNTLYKVLIDIYDPTSGKKVASYDGGMAN